MAVNFKSGLKVPMSAYGVLKHSQKPAPLPAAALKGEQPMMQMLKTAEVKIEGVLENGQILELMSGFAPEFNVSVETDDHGAMSTKCKVYIKMSESDTSMYIDSKLKAPVMVDPEQKFLADIGDAVLEFEKDWTGHDPGMVVHARVSKMLNSLYEQQQKDADIAYLISTIGEMNAVLKAESSFGSGNTHPHTSEVIARGDQIVDNLKEAMAGRLKHAWLNEGAKTTLCWNKPTGKAAKATPVLVVLPDLVS